MRIRRLLFALVLPVALLAACGGGDDDDDDAAASGDDTEDVSGDDDDGGDVACPEASVVTDTVGVAAADADPTDTPDYLQCTYSIEDPEAGVFGVVNVKLYRSGAQDGMEIFNDVAEDEESVEGVGEGASWSPSGTNLFVVQGDGGVEILFTGLPEDADAKQLAIDLATAVL
jgi:hypothetical protein